MDVAKDKWAYVKTVRSMGGHRLLLEFEDGRRGTYDMTPLLQWGVYAPLRDTHLFEKVHVEGGTATWPGDIDIAPEELYANCVLESPNIETQAS